jgi:hypothetical protein
MRRDIHRIPVERPAVEPVGRHQRLTVPVELRQSSDQDRLSGADLQVARRDVAGLPRFDLDLLAEKWLAQAPGHSGADMGVLDIRDGQQGRGLRVDVEVD